MKADELIAELQAFVDEEEILIRPEFFWNKNETWRCTYKGLILEVAHHGVSEYIPLGIWNTYLIVTKRVFPEFYNEARAPDDGIDYPCDYDDVFNDLSWNGSPTFAEQTKEYIKIGDDHIHSWDRDRKHNYNLGYMQKKIIRIADELLEIIENRKVRAKNAEASA